MSKAAQDQPPLELRRSYFDGREIILFDNGTWRFADDSVDFSAGPDARQIFDFSLADHSAQFSLDPREWTHTDALSDQSVSNHHFQAAGGFSASVSHQTLGGHGGDIARNSGHKSRPLIGRLIVKASEIMLSGILPQEQEHVIGNVIVTETYFADAMTYYLHIMGAKDALSVDLALSDPEKRADSSQDKTDRPLFDAKVQSFRQNLTLGGTALNDIHPSKPSGKANRD